MHVFPHGNDRQVRPLVGTIAPKHVFNIAALLIALWLDVASPAQASEQGPLGLSAAVQAAMARSQALSAQDAAARSARDAAVAAGQRPDPVLRFSLNNLPIEGENRFSTSSERMTSKAISLMQAFPAKGKRQARSQRFEREADVALATRAQRAASLRRDTAIAWWERHAQEQRVSLLREQLSENRLQLEAAEAATRGALPAGANSPAVEWLTARDAVAQTHQALLGAEAALDNARQTLARWTGTPLDQSLGEAHTLTSLAFSATGFAPHLQQHPDLALFSARLSAAAADAELARQDRQPDWTGELAFVHRRPGFDNMVSLAVSVPLQWDRAQRQDRLLAARLARVDELQAEREERSRELLAEAERWLAAWRGGLEQLALIDKERLPLARQRADLAQAAYRGGNARLGDVLAARRMALAVEMERIEVQLSTARLWARLEYLLPNPADLSHSNAAAALDTAAAPAQKD
jgi:outer membrane protein TolC